MGFAATLGGDPSRSGATPLLIAMLLPAFLACATPEAPPPAREPFPPPDLATLSEVERRGYDLYRHDQAAWLATDEALAQGLRDTPAEGWITLEQYGGTILVRFAGPCDAGVCSFLDVSTGTGTPIVTRPQPVALPPEQAGAWRARHLAASSGFRACSSHYNSVVLPTEYEGAAAWEVFLLAATVVPEEVVLAGHHRFVVSFDGRSLLQHEPLSNSCLVSRPAEDEGPLASLMVSHVLHPEPIATHVFTSLNYQLPLYVLIDHRIYRIDGAKIRFLEELPEESDPAPSSTDADRD